jgi:hypothetical protein
VDNSGDESKDKQIEQLFLCKKWAYLSRRLAIKYKKGLGYIAQNCGDYKIKKEDDRKKHPNAYTLFLGYLGIS